MDRQIERLEDEIADYLDELSLLKRTLEKMDFFMQSEHQGARKRIMFSNLKKVESDIKRIKRTIGAKRALLSNAQRATNDPIYSTNAETRKNAVRSASIEKSREVDQW